MTYETPSELAGLIVTTMARVDQVMDEVELLKIKGSVATISALPSGATAGDAYVVEADGHLYGWVTTAWIDFGAFQGEQGLQGQKGWSPVLAVVTDGARRVQRIVAWAGGAGDPPASGQYIGPLGLVTNIGDAVDIRGSQGDQGEKGWSPVITLEADGARIVARITDWLGGEGDDPPTGKYLGDGVLVTDIEDAVDVRGPAGPTGPEAWAAPVAWTTATAFVATAPRSIVTQGGRSYACTVSHTSGTFSTDLAANRWILIADKGADGLGTGTVQSTGSPSVGQLARFADGSGVLLEGVAATKGLVGLGNVDNTSDADKGVSDATQDALDLKADANAVVTPADLRRDMIRLMFEMSALKGNQYGTPNGIADDFSDQDGVDAAASSGEAYDAGAKLYKNSLPPIEVMTSNSAPSGNVASSSSVLSSDYQPYKAFNGLKGADSAGYWAPLLGSSSPAWIRRQFPLARTVGSYAVTTINQAGAGLADYSPKTWTLRGSNDGSSWTTVDTVSAETGWSVGETRTYTVDSPGSYSYYEMLVTDTQGGFSTRIPCIQEIEFFDGGGSEAALDLRSNAVVAVAAPTRASVLVVAKCNTSFTLNTHLTAAVSRDAGTTWTAVTLIQREALSGGYTMFEALDADISAQPSGTSMKWRVEGSSGKGWEITAVVLKWN